eukprot:190780_1
MLDHGKNKPVRAVSLIPGRDIAPPKWPCRLSILGLAWLLLSSNAPIWVLCSSQQPVQRGGISPPGYGEPTKAQHHGETGRPQQSYNPGGDPSRPPPPLQQQHQQQQQQIGRQSHHGIPQIGEVHGGGRSFGSIPGPPQQQYGAEGIGQWPGEAYPARGGQPNQQQGVIRGVDGYPSAQQQQQGGGGDSFLGRLTNRIRPKTSEPVGQSMYQGNPAAQPQGSNQNWGRGRWSEPQGVCLSRGQPQQWGGEPTYKQQQSHYHQQQPQRQQQQQHPGYPGDGAVVPQSYLRGSPQPMPPLRQHHFQEGQYGGGRSVSGQEQEGAGLWHRIKEKVFSGEGEGESSIVQPPSFRPKGSSLPQKSAAETCGSAIMGVPGYMGFNAPGVGMVIGATGEQEPEGSGTPQVLSVDGSIALVPRPNGLEVKKRKFKEAGQSKIQIITLFDSVLTKFNAEGDNLNHCLKTHELLEQNQHVMLPEAAKKIRYLRTDFRRHMDVEGKSMSHLERIKAMEGHLRKVYNTAAMEGGIHMNSIGPAVEGQLGRVPLRTGVGDMLTALAYRGIPTTIFCPGYGNVAMEVVRKNVPGICGPNGSFNPHLRLVSNFFRPDDTLTIVGMFNMIPLIHDLNKNGATISSFLEAVHVDTNIFKLRSNILLLGSDPSDLALIDGLEGVQEKIAVGYLKMDENFLEKLPRYAELFDVVILGDGDMAFPNELLYEVTRS